MDAFLDGCFDVFLLQPGMTPHLAAFLIVLSLQIGLTLALHGTAFAGRAASNLRRFRWLAPLFLSLCLLHNLYGDNFSARSGACLIIFNELLSVPLSLLDSPRLTGRLRVVTVTGILIMVAGDIVFPLFNTPGHP